MPESSFFDPMSMGGGAPMPMAGSPFQPPKNPNLIARYRNQYGTDVGLDYGLGTGSVGGHVNIPIGAYEKGLNAGLSAFYRPAGMSGPSDAGAVLTFGKVNRAQVSGDQVLGDPGISPAYAAFLKANPDQLEKERVSRQDRLNNIGAIGSSKYDFQLGIVPEGSGRPNGSVSPIVGQDGQYNQQPQRPDGPAYLNQYIQRNMLGIEN
ncbi:hypothetical protein EBT25_00555 [bacterium]|nr:hypothetical protein [bacterium]